MEWVGLDSDGASGGVLVMWDSLRVSVVEVVKGQFSISILFHSENGEPRWISGIYGPSRPRGGRAF